MNKYNAVMDESHKDNIKQRRKIQQISSYSYISKQKQKQTILCRGTYLGRLQFTVNKLRTVLSPLGRSDALIRKDQILGAGK